MPDQLTATGLQLLSLEEREIEIRADLLTISPILSFLPDALMGELVSIFAEREQAVIELVAAVYFSQYPDSATGVSLEAVSALTGTTKRAATKSTIPSTSASVQLDAGVTLIAGSVAHVDGDPTARFVTDVAVTNSGGAPAWVPCAFTAEEPGPVQAPAGTLTVIAEPVSGWLGVSSSGDAVLGEAVESDTELRARREQEVAQGGATTANAIRAELSALDGMLWCQVRANETEDYDPVTGAPPKTVTAVVYAPTLTDAAIAAAIWAVKAFGIKAWGTTIVAVEDDEGFSHNVGFVRATVVPLYITAALLVDDESYEGDTAAKQAIVAWCDENLSVGETARLIPISAVFLDEDLLAGVVDVNSCRIGRTAPGSAANLVASWNEIFEADTSRTTVTSI